MRKKVYLVADTVNKQKKIGLSTLLDFSTALQELHFSLPSISSEPGRYGDALLGT